MATPLLCGVPALLAHAPTLTVRPAALAAVQPPALENVNAEAELLLEVEGDEVGAISWKFGSQEWIGGLLEACRRLHTPKQRQQSSPVTGTAL